MMRSEFSLDRTSGVLLEAQFAEWLKSEIARGCYLPDAALPGIVELSRTCHVSTTTVRAALGRLAAEGWVRPVRHVGSVVLKRGGGIRRKRVLLWEPGTFFCYYSNQFLARLRFELLRGKDGASVVGANARRGRHPLLELEQLLREPWDAVIAHGCVESVSRMVEAAGCPLVAVGNGDRIDAASSRRCAGRIEVLNGLALPDFARECVRKNVKTVFQVLLHEGAYDVTDLLRISGIPVRTFRTLVLDTPEAVSKAGFSIVDSWFADDRIKLPDVVLFADDYMARGGLIALKKHGVRVPEDVAVVTHANKGDRPIWEKPLTCMEMDPEAHAVVVAKAVRAFLHGRPFPEGIVLGATWRPGQTF